MKNILVSLALTFLTVTASYASSPIALQQSTNVNQITADVLSSRLRHEGLSNKMISGVSLFYALSILESGAAAESKALLSNYLLHTRDVNLTSAAPSLIKQLVTPPSTIEGIGAFEINSTLWATNGGTNNQPFTFNKVFERNAQRYYEAPANTLDFMKPGASSAINEWANTATHGLIPEVINDGMLKQLEWLIASAAYFEGAWETPMQRIAPDTNYRFRLLDGSTVSPTSIATRDFQNRVLDRADGSIAFDLPFMGGKYSFIAFLPPESEDDLEDWLTKSAPLELPEVVADVLNNDAMLYELYVQMPEFSFSDETSLTRKSPIIQDLDLELLFSDSANFEPMIDRELSLPRDKETKVGIIKQDTRIELDENGVKAAAVTLIGGIIKSTSVGWQPPRRNIIVDRPFVFAIVENSSQTILFSGILIEPEQA